jgi:protein-L-isoaspartate O-methyltransferase
MMDDEEVVKANSDFLVTETTVDPKLPVDKVVAWLRQRRATGQLIFHITQGGIQKVALVEKTRAVDGQREKIREILGV